MKRRTKEESENSIGQSYNVPLRDRRSDCGDLCSSPMSIRRLCERMARSWLCPKLRQESVGSGAFDFKKEWIERNRRKNGEKRRARCGENMRVEERENSK